MAFEEPLTSTEFDLDEFDPAIITLCEAINEFPGITTSESCQGYIDNHRPGEAWTVYFGPNGPIASEAYCAIEFLAWLLGPREAGAAGFDVSLTLSSAPPYLNEPGRTMSFCIEGRNRHPDELAALIRKMRHDCFVTAEEWSPPDKA